MAERTVLFYIIAFLQTYFPTVRGNLAALVNENVSIHCRLLNAVFWEKNLETIELNPAKYQMEAARNGSILKIFDVQLNDSATYTCYDKGNAANSSKLIVFGSPFTCDVAPNVTEERNLTISCQVPFQGDMIPTVWCKQQQRDNVPLQLLELQTVHDKTAHALRASGLLIADVSLNGSKLSCELKYEQIVIHSSLSASTLHWTSPTITVFYGPRATNIAVTGCKLLCTAESNPPAEYYWIDAVTGKELGHGSTLELTLLNERQFKVGCVAINTGSMMTERKDISVNVTAMKQTTGTHQLCLEIIGLAAEEITALVVAIVGGVLIVLMVATVLHVWCKKGLRSHFVLPANVAFSSQGNNAPNHGVQVNGRNEDPHHAAADRAAAQIVPPLPPPPPAADAAVVNDDGDRRLPRIADYMPMRQLQLQQQPSQSRSQPQNSIATAEGAAGPVVAAAAAAAAVGDGADDKGGQYAELASVGAHTIYVNFNQRTGATAAANVGPAVPAQYVAIDHSRAASGSNPPAPPAVEHVAITAPVRPGVLITDI